jgi:hypothetical protein
MTEIVSVAKGFLTASVKIIVKNKIIFSGHIITAESCVIFTGYTKPPKIILFLAATNKTNPYFWQLNTVKNRQLPPKIAYFWWLPCFSCSKMPFSSYKFFFLAVALSFE